MLSVATWNINSARLRLPIIEKYLEMQAPDVLCLQEIKCQEHQFPAEALAKLGYE
ncbi:MAG: endonuclease/exonuclease/phosphatase family protein, partial [Erythrobacter sp.]